MRPLADYECVTCGKAEGTPAVIPDLPIDCKRCPYCGKAKGFARLFDSVNVIGGKARELNKIVDESLEPIYQKTADVKAGAERFTSASADALEKSYEKATPAERAKAQPFVNRAVPAAGALGSLPPQARQDSRECLYPATKRVVQPLWQK